ncbi:DUF3632 domain-containing protein [Saccharopolyspora sp. MS10]|uniref:DUF3632 domain-containing protein n=1 Tax=Saccharopolyspora sp. MS10 TaxID=3385973 RepID=UPI0039A0034A
MDHQQARRHYQDLLADHLRGARTAQDGARRFAEPVRRACADNPGEDAVAEILWAAWEPVLATARTSPDHHPRLVALLSALRDLDPPPRGRTVWGLEVFTDLPCFGAQLRETWDLAPHHDDPGQPHLHAFAARLTAARIDFSLHALWTLREHLEHTAPPPDLAAVVSWARHGSAALAARARAHRTFTDHDRGVDRLGPLARDRGVPGHGFSPRRWQFWRTRLAELGTPDARTALALLPEA